MTIVVELEANAERQLRHAVSRRDKATVQKVLTEAVASVADNLLEPVVQKPENDEFDSILDRLIAEVTKRRAVPGLALTDYATTRTSIYEK